MILVMERNNSVLIKWIHRWNKTCKAMIEHNSNIYIYIYIYMSTEMKRTMVMMKKRREKKERKNSSMTILCQFIHSESFITILMNNQWSNARMKTKRIGTMICVCIVLLFFPSCVSGQFNRRKEKRQSMENGCSWW